MATDLGQKAGGDEGGYGYSYGYGGYPAGMGGEGAGTAHRNLRDYLLILRERVWYIIVVFCVVFGSVAAYTFTTQKKYRAVATIQILRSDPTLMQVQQVVDTDIRGTEDLNTQLKVLESIRLIQQVVQRVKADGLEDFLAPYDLNANDPAVMASMDNKVAAILGQNRQVALQRGTLMVNLAYTHPDRSIAAKVANYFAEEFLAYNLMMRSQEAAKAVEDMQLQVKDQQKLVEKMASDMQEYRERTMLHRRELVAESLKAANADVGRARSVLAEAEIRRTQLQTLKEKGGNLAELQFIGNGDVANVVGLMTQQLANRRIALAAIKERYRAKHPKYIEAVNALEQTQRELDRAIEVSSAQMESEYQSAKKNFEQHLEELARRREESLELDRAALEYNDRERELRTNEQILQNIVARSRETSVSSGMATQNARIMDPALPSPEGAFVVPNIPLNLGLGVVGGLGLGLAFAFLVAFFDDRVKSSYDVETVVGLPLLGIIPQIKDGELSDKAQIVANKSDRQVAESFLGLHSSLRLKEESKAAKCMLITSTIPGEGKTLCTTNIALTFASNGEKVVIVDCDLRKPNVHRSLKLENERGLIDICAGTMSIDQVVVRNVHTNLDVIPTGGRAKNPTQVLNSKAFAALLDDLRQRYDRVFIDSPPLAAVTDAMNILPMIDGAIFVIFFNKVARKAAKFSADKLAETKVPVFGAVLNGLNLAVSGYYYAQYYHKSYKDYYVVSSGKGKGKEDLPEER